MNCKPGDLAVVVRAYGWGTAGEISRAIVGRIARVTRLVPPKKGFRCLTPLVWEFEEPMRVERGGKKYVIHGTADDCLRPIRDPGEDAQDETLSWLPVPERDEVPA